MFANHMGGNSQMVRNYVYVSYGRGTAKWYEIMSMFPTELAAESNT